MRYRNKKNGEIYCWISNAVDSTNYRDGTKVVIYHRESNPNDVYVREQAEFHEKFDRIEDEPI